MKIELCRLLSWRPGKLARGTLSMTVAMGLRTLGQGVVFLIIARVLGVEAYGAYSVVLALAMTLGGFGGLGVSIIMLRETARDPAAFAASWGRSLAALLVTTPPLFMVYLLLAWAILPSQINLGVLVCLGVAEILLAPLTLAAVQAYRGYERTGRAARILLVPVLPRLAAAVLILLLVFAQSMPERLPIWAVAYMWAAAVSTGYALWLLNRDFALGLEFRWDGLARAMYEGWAFSFGGVAQKVYVDVDKIMLARFANLEVAGTYSAAYRVVDMASVPLYSFLISVAPRFFRAGRAGLRDTLLYAIKVLPMPLAYVSLVSICLYLLADWLPWLLGRQFVGAIESLRWLAWLPIFSMPRYFLAMVLESSDHQNAAVFVVIFGALLNLIFNLFAIPLWGWVGAVVATYVAELMMTFLLIVLAVRAWRESIG